MTDPTGSLKTDIETLTAQLADLNEKWAKTEARRQAAATLVSLMDPVKVLQGLNGGPTDGTRRVIAVAQIGTVLFILPLLLNLNAVERWTTAAWFLVCAAGILWVGRGKAKRVEPREPASERWYR